MVADEKLIAAALVRFNGVIEELEPDEQKEIFGLLILEIRVKHFGPEKNSPPEGKGNFATKIRTSGFQPTLLFSQAIRFQRLGKVAE